MEYTASVGSDWYYATFPHPHIKEEQRAAIRTFLNGITDKSSFVALSNPWVTVLLREKNTALMLQVLFPEIQILKMSDWGLPVYETNT